MSVILADRGICFLIDDHPGPEAATQAPYHDACRNASLTVQY